MKNRNDLITFLNISVILFHLALIGIFVGNPFNDVANITLAVVIPLFLIFFSVLIEKKTKNSVSGAIYHLVGCWSLLVSFFYIVGTDVVINLELSKGVISSFFFFLLALLSMISSIRLEKYQFMYASYISILLMFLSILLSFDVNQNVSYVVIALTISILDIMAHYKGRDPHNILSIASAISLVVFTMLVFKEPFIYVLSMSLIVFIGSMLKMFVLKDENEKRYTGYKIIAIIFVMSSLIKNVYIYDVVSTTLALIAFTVISRKLKIDKKYIDGLFALLCVLNIWVVDYRSDYILYLYLAVYYAISMSLNRENKAIECASICLATIFGYSYFNNLLSSESLKEVLFFTIYFIVVHVLCKYLCKETKNKDAFLTAFAILLLGYASVMDSIACHIFVVFISIVYAYYSYIVDKEYQGLRIISVVFGVVGGLRILNYFITLPMSIYILIAAVILSVYMLYRLNDDKQYCKYCKKEISEGSKFCEHCGKKI